LTAPPRVAVAGVGNWLMAEDRVGPRVLDSIAERYGDAVDRIDLGTGGLALLDHLRAQDLLIVVDACTGRGEAGQVFLEEDRPAGEEPRGVSLHQIGPREALEIAREIAPQSMPARVVWLLVETEGLDDAGAQRAHERALAEIGCLIEGGVHMPRDCRGSEEADDGRTSG
jgi:hydrogenase maturation protease